MPAAKDAERTFQYQLRIISKIQLMESVISMEMWQTGLAPTIFAMVMEPIITIQILPILNHLIPNPLIPQVPQVNPAIRLLLHQPQTLQHKRCRNSTLMH